MLKGNFGLRGFATLLVASGCSGKISLLPDGGAGGSDNPGAQAKAGSSANSAGSTPSGAGVGGSPGAWGFMSAASGSGGAIAGGASVGEGGSEPFSAGAAGTASALRTCAGPSAIQCATGEFCDLASNCGAISQAKGVCAATGVLGNCDDVEDPEGSSCGCEGKTTSTLVSAKRWACCRRREGCVRVAASPVTRQPTVSGKRYAGTVVRGRLWW